MAPQRIKKVTVITGLEPLPEPPAPTAEDSPKKPPPHPRNCRSYALNRFAEDLPIILDALLDQARSGSVTHLKALMQLTGLDKAEPEEEGGEKSLEQCLDEQWVQHKQYYEPWLQWLAKQRPPQPATQPETTP